MQSKKFRVQRDSLKAINIAMALFIKLLTKTCEVVQTTSVSASGVSGKRSSNALDVDHLSKAVTRYEVLAFMKDLVEEIAEKSLANRELDPIVDDSEDVVSKRKERPDDADKEEQKRLKGDVSQMSLSFFFKPT